MAKSDGTVYVDTRIDTKGFGKGVNTMQKQIGGLSGAIGKLGIAIAAAFAVKKLVQFGKEAIDLGSDLQEVQNVVDVTFSTMNESVNEFARNAAESAGLSETMAKRYAGTFGAMAKAFGFAEGEAFDMSTSLTQLAGDVASFYNLTQDEAYTKLKSVFTGETESLKDLGVVMTQTALDSFAMAEGYGKTTKQMSEQEKVALRYAFVLDQLSTASGDFVRTQDSWANQTRILSLNFDSFKANIGQALINIFTPFLKVINQIVSKMAQLSQHFVAFSEMLVGKQTSGGGGSPGDALAEIESGYEGITDATNEAAKEQKKYVTGLDEIRTFADENVGIDDIGISGIGGFNDLDVTKDAVEDTTDLIAELEAKYPELIQFAKDSTQKLKEIFNDFAVGDFFEAGNDVSELVTSIFDFISQAIEDVDWDELGTKIGDFLAGIDWLKVIESGFKLKFSIWDAIAKVWFGAFKAAPIETAIFTGFAALKLTPLGGILAPKIAKALVGTSLVQSLIGSWASLGGLGGILMTDLGVVIGAGSFAEIALTFVTGLVGAILAAFGGFALGEQISALIWPENKEIIKQPWDEQWKAIFDSFKDGSFVGAFKLMGDDLSKWFSDLWGNISSGATEFFDGIVTKAKEQLNNIIFAINFLIDCVESGVNSVIDILNGLSFDVPDWVPLFGGREFDLNITRVNVPRVPYLATGAVIPPNAPFMAMLGDQKHGNNLEMPEDLLRKVVREESGKSKGGSYVFQGVIDRRVLFEEFMDEAALQMSMTGRNPFDFA